MNFNNQINETLYVNKMKAIFDEENESKINPIGEETKILNVQKMIIMK